MVWCKEEVQVPKLPLDQSSNANGAGGQTGSSVVVEGTDAVENDSDMGICRLSSKHEAGESHE